MHISLTSELESRIKSKVESGLYNNASEVVREALRFMDTHQDWIHEAKLAQLRQSINIGIEQIDAGDALQIKSAKALDDLFEDLKK